MRKRFQRISAEESGVTIIEVIVSALLVVTISTFVFTALNAANRAGAQERYRATAYGIAQEDQARIRSLQVSEQTRLNQTTTATVAGETYTIVSTGTPKIDRNATSACDSGNSSADYISITSTVTWPNMSGHIPVVIESIISPPNGSLDANRGALGVSIIDSRNAPYSGITVTGTGAGSFSGTTASTGCALFGDLPVGNYTVTASLSNLVDKDGLVPAGVTTSVVAQSSNTLALQYDKGGTVPVNFKTINPAGSLVASSADTIMAFNSGMTQAKQFGTLGTNAATLTATPLFPFTSADSFYAGNCTTNNPTSGLALASVLVPLNSVPAAAQTIQLPALRMTVKSGISSTTPGSLVNAARVTATDQNCLSGGVAVKRVLATNASGVLGAASATSTDNPGLPYSTNYTICVSGMSSSATVKKVTFSNVQLTSPTAPRDVGTVYLNSGTTGACP